MIVALMKHEEPKFLKGRSLGMLLPSSARSKSVCGCPELPVAGRLKTSPSCEWLGCRSWEQSVVRVNLYDSVLRALIWLRVECAIPFSVLSAWQLFIGLFLLRTPVISCTDLC